MTSSAVARRGPSSSASTSSISDLRAPIQRAWGPGGLVHVADSPDIGGPGPRVSMTRVKLRNHGNLVARRGVDAQRGRGQAESRPRTRPRDRGRRRTAYSCSCRSSTDRDRFPPDGAERRPRARRIALAVRAGGCQAVRRQRSVAGASPSSTSASTREYAVDDSYEKVIEAFAPGSDTRTARPRSSSAIEQLHRCRDTDADIANFVQRRPRRRRRGRGRHQGRPARRVAHDLEPGRGSRA